jgi:hypothetical protein
MSLKKYLTEAELAAVQPITGDAFDISIRELTNIESVVVEHTQGSITIQLDDVAIKMLEECGCIFEDEQLDELAPVIGALGAAGGALARGVTAGAGALARGAAKAAVGTGIKAAADKLDKKLFGPNPHEEDYEESKKIHELDDNEDELDYTPVLGDIVKIDYPSLHQGDYGEVVELSPSEDFAYVQFKDGDIQSYHNSDLVKANEDEIEQYYHGSDDEFEESINSIRKLSGMAPKETVKEESYDKSSGSPYDRGAADSYYGRKARPHKMVPASDGVKGQMQMVSLTDPKEIAAYNAGYSENDDRKNYGEGIEDWNMSVTSIPRTEPFKLKNIVVKSPGGKTYTFDTEEDARRLFLDKWNFVKDPKSGWKVEMNNTKPTDESNLSEREGDWAAGAAGLLKAVAFLIGVPIIAMGQIWKNDLPIVDSPLGKAMYDAAARGDRDAEEALKKLDDIGVQRLPMQYIEKLSDKYLHKGNLGESVTYQKIKATLTEAEYRGRKVPLGKPMQGDVAKFKVYVKDPKTGNVKKVNFGDKTMRIKKSNPKRRKSFRARHRCKNPGPRTKARYWSCRAW